MKFLQGLILSVLLASIHCAAETTLEDLMKTPAVTDVKISPTGEYLALRVFDEESKEYALIFYRVEDFKTTGALKFGGSEHVGPFWWVNDERVVLEIIDSPSSDVSPKFYGELYAVNFDGSRRELIFGYRAGDAQTGTLITRKEYERAWGEPVDFLESDPDNIIISSTKMSREHDRRSVAQLLDVYTGDDKRRLKVSKFPEGRFYTDLQGNIRLVTSIDSAHEMHIEVLPDTKSSTWIDLDDSSIGNYFTPVGVSEDGNSYYVLDDLEGDKVGLYKLALDGSGYKQIYANDRVDIEGVESTSDGRGVFAILLYDGYPKYLLFSEDFPEARVFKKLLATFPGQLVSITSKSKDARFWIVRTSSDIDPGSFYLFDNKISQIRKLYSVNPEIDPKDLSPMEPVTFSSFDGRSISGYFTRAKSDDEQTPLVVLVHGGPRARDYWGYNRKVQALSTHGFSVLQINYRGSSGYGKAFLEAGNLQWGGDVQKDIISGTRWAIANKDIDPGRVCIMGASFGAYSAVQSAELAPDLFACVVANAGIYDLPLMYEKGDTEEIYWGESFLNESIGTDTEQLKAFSPVTHVESLQAPILIAHGKRDVRAPYEHAKRLEHALKNHHKEYEKFVKREEGHGFYDPSNRIAYMKAAIEFIDNNLREQ